MAIEEVRAARDCDLKQGEDDDGEMMAGRREEEFLVMRVMISGNDLRKRKKNSI